ncbi:MAG TPA: undecaprenyl-diphosphatase UppP [Pyrinomonadaceae bacterium]|jgi:undecaprenyl-diphosphatase|nr:undecaprenyl-diphosphatase UppP [Pyrinomonadaceae bacterium]
MSILQAIILGIVQGLTEFIPISSTAHLIFAGRALGLYEGVEQTLRAERTTATIAVIQLGTLLAVLVYFARDIWNITYAFVRDHLALMRGGKSEAAMEMTMVGQRQSRLSHEAWLGWLVIIGSIPIGTIGLFLKKLIEGPFTKNLWIIATMMIVVAVLLAVAEVVGKRKREMEDLGVRDALAVGGAQVLALMPGASRSGSTIMGGLFAGETRETAARFSFLLSIPAIAASGLLELKEAVEKLPTDSYVSLAVATVVSGVVGYASIWFLLRFLRTHSTAVFIGYRLVVGVAILALLFAGVIGATDAAVANPTATPAQQNAPLLSTPTPDSNQSTNQSTNNRRQNSVNSSRPSSRRARSWNENK